MITTAKLILTGKETYDPEYSTISKQDALEAMVEFAKIHVTEALKEASKQCYAQVEHDCAVIDKSSILNAYPEFNIK